MTACTWCSADIDKPMPNGISPHATWCPHYRKPREPRVGKLAEMAAYAERKTKEGTPTFVMPESSCSACGRPMDMAASIERSAVKPKPSDVTICFRCGHLMGFKDDLTLRELTDEEAHAIAADPDMLRVQALRAAALKRTRGSG